MLCFYSYTIAKLFSLTCHNKHLDQLYSRCRLSRLLVDLQALNHVWGIGHKSRQINCCCVFFSLRTLLNVISSQTWGLRGTCGTNGTYPIRYVWRGPGVEPVLFIKTQPSTSKDRPVFFFFFFFHRPSSCSTVGVERGGNVKVPFTESFMSSSGQGLEISLSRERFLRESLAGAERSHLAGGSVLSGRIGRLPLQQQLTTRNHTRRSILSGEKSRKSLLDNLSRHRGS